MYIFLHDNTSNKYVCVSIANRNEIPVIVNVRFGEFKVLAASGDGGGIMVAGETKAEK